MCSAEALFFPFCGIKSRINFSTECSVPQGEGDWKYKTSKCLKTKFKLNTAAKGSVFIIDILTI